MYMVVFHVFGLMHDLTLCLFTEMQLRDLQFDVLTIREHRQ
jgi:hypothetical protein